MVNFPTMMILKLTFKTVVQIILNQIFRGEEPIVRKRKVETWKWCLDPCLPSCLEILSRNLSRSMSGFFSWGDVIELVTYHWSSSQTTEVSLEHCHVLNLNHYHSLPIGKAVNLSLMWFVWAPKQFRPKGLAFDWYGLEILDIYDIWALKNLKLT